MRLINSAIIDFPQKNKTLLADDVLESALDANLESVVIIGTGKDKELVLFSTSNKKAEIAHELNKILHSLYNGEFDAD